MLKCYYCDNQATKTLVWLKDISKKPARIKRPWCGCDLQISFQKFCKYPYKVIKSMEASKIYLLTFIK